jgi:hypothetical protein
MAATAAAQERAMRFQEVILQATRGKNVMVAGGLGARHQPANITSLARGVPEVRSSRSAG